MGSGWELLRAYTAGSRDALTALVGQEQRYLEYLCFRYARHLSGYADVHDIVDETWYAVLRRVGSGDVPWGAPLRSWLGGLLRNVLKSGRLRPQGAGDQDGAQWTDGEGDPSDAVAEAELHAALAQCLDGAPAALRNLNTLIYVNGLGKAETGRHLGCSEAYVRQKMLPRLHRLLANCLSTKGFATDGSNREALRTTERMP